MAQRYQSKIAEHYEAALTALVTKFGRTSLLGRTICAILPVSIVEIESCTFEVHPRDNHTEYQLFMHRRPTEPKTLNYLMQRCTGKRVHFIDIGANCGIFSIPVACTSDPGSTIIAFEPNPVMQKRLTRNIQLNDLHNITLHPVAVGPQEAITMLHFAPGRMGNYGGASLVMHSESHKGVEVQVKVLTPDLVAASGEYDFRALKIDVEGFEDRALYGFITQSPDEILPEMIIIETDHKQMWELDLLTAFAARGYSATQIMYGNHIYERALLNG
jgi:FkbM family methyltransferase